jgi:hypothetical protein
LISSLELLILTERARQLFPERIPEKYFRRAARPGRWLGARHLPGRLRPRGPDPFLEEEPEEEKN